jgi:transcription antitermination factor NusG
MAEHCRLNSMDHYLPVRQETKIYQRRKVVVQKPVFPGYLFASFERAGRLTLLKTNNIVKILRPEHEENLLTELSQIRLALDVDPTLGSCAALKKGRRVRIIGGPFMGIEGVIWTLRKGNTKIRLNVDMIGRAVAVDVDRDYLELVND